MVKHFSVIEVDAGSNPVVLVIFSFPSFESSRGQL